MALIRHCDRCDSDAEGVKPYTLMSDDEGQPFCKADLCRDCQTQAHAFFRGEYSDENWNNDDDESEEVRG